MNKKGFTLTELLAVIVILVVLSLIVIPIVNDQVNLSKQKSFESSIGSVKRAVQYYMDQKDLKGENNEYIYNIDVEDLKMSNIETLKGQVIVTKTETGYDIKYNGITNGQFTYYGDSENGTIYKQSDIKKDSDVNSSDSIVFENVDPILISNDENIIVDDCYKNVIVKDTLSNLENRLSVIGGELELVANSIGYYGIGAKVKLLKNGDTVDAYDIVMANGESTGDAYINALDLMMTQLCLTNDINVSKTCFENGLTKQDDLTCLYADFDYNRIITQDELSQHGKIAVSCTHDPKTGLNTCDFSDYIGDN